MKHIIFNTPNGGLEISIDNDCGCIEHALTRETCPYCNQWDCNFSCDESQSEADDDEVIGRLAFNAGLDVLESLVISHACAGVDVEDSRYRAGLVDTLEAMANHS